MAGRKDQVARPGEVSRCNCTALRKASRRVSQLYDTALAPSGLKTTQRTILAQIGLGASAEPLEVLRGYLAQPVPGGRNACLIVLDFAGQLSNDSDLVVQRLLREIPNVTVLATARKRCHHGDRAPACERVSVSQTSRACARRVWATSAATSSSP